MTPQQLRPTTRTRFFWLSLPAILLLLQPAAAQADLIYAAVSGGTDVLRFEVNPAGATQSGIITNTVSYPGGVAFSPGASCSSRIVSAVGLVTIPGGSNAAPIPWLRCRR